MNYRVEFFNLKIMMDNDNNLLRFFLIFRFPDALISNLQSDTRLLYQINCTTGAEMPRSRLESVQETIAA